jgi:oligosaccharide repeat unit polymerase
MNFSPFIFSPSLLYITVWTVTIWLQSLQILNFYKPINWNFISMQILAYIILLISEFVIKERYKSFYQVVEKKHKKIEQLYSFCRPLFPLLIVMFIIDIIYSGGVPLFWLISGNGLTHSDFGIPTFHGAFHGILLFFVTSSFFLFRQGIHKKENFIHIVFFFFYACLSFNRGIIFIFIFQALFIYLIMLSKLNLRYIILLILFSLFFIWIFGILGDFRTGCNTFSRNITSEWHGFFNFFPKSLIWFYTYSTSGLNNLYGNIPNVHPGYVPYYTFSRLVPTIFYNLLGIPKACAFTLVDGRGTISTAFEGLVSDFGLIGILLYLPIIVFAQVSYYRALKNSFFSIIIYGILMQTILMTIFVDTFFYLPFLLQIFLLCYVNYQENIQFFFKKHLFRSVKYEICHNHAKN